MGDQHLLISAALVRRSSRYCANSPCRKKGRWER